MLTWWPVFFVQWCQFKIEMNSITKQCMNCAHTRSKHCNNCPRVTESSLFYRNNEAFLKGHSMIYKAQGLGLVGNTVTVIVKSSAEIKGFVKL